MTRSYPAAVGILQRWRQLTAFAATAAWLLAALTCPSFGQPIANDETAVAHEHATSGAAEKADTDLCCKLLGDSATILRAPSQLKPQLAQASAPSFAVVHQVRPAGVFNAPPLDRPPLYETARSRPDRFVTFQPHAPPSTDV